MLSKRRRNTRKGLRALGASVRKVSAVENFASRDAAFRERLCCFAWGGGGDRADQVNVFNERTCEPWNLCWWVLKGVIQHDERIEACTPVARAMDDILPVSEARRSAQIQGSAEHSLLAGQMRGCVRPRGRIRSSWDGRGACLGVC